MIRERALLSIFIPAVSILCACASHSKNMVMQKEPDPPSQTSLVLQAVIDQEETHQPKVRAQESSRSSWKSKPLPQKIPPSPQDWIYQPYPDGGMF